MSCQEKYGGASRRRIHEEEQAAAILAKARQQMNAGEYDAARRSVRLLRDSCRYALTGREQGILLLDSIELFQARTDTTADDYEQRERFYTKKIEHDINRMMHGTSETKE